jgi:Fe2+ or Zn2+ uptake regulation protein
LARVLSLVCATKKLLLNVPVAEYKSSKLLDIILKRLKASGGRMTKKREVLLGALLTFDRPASAEEIRARAELPASDLVTVYRNLETFEKLGVLQRVPLENGTHLFELTAPDEHYHHLICRDCHKVERLDVCLGQELVKKAKMHRYTQIAHVLEAYGVCEDCEQVG